MSRLLIARLTAALLVLVSVVACDGFGPAAPELSLSLSAGQSVQPDQPVTLYANGRASPIEQLELRLEGATLGSLKVPPGEWSLGPVELTLHLPAELPDGALSLNGSARDALGRVVGVDVELLHESAREPATSFLISNPSDGDAIGGVERRMVSVAVGANGTLSDGLVIESVRVFVDGVEIGTATLLTEHDTSLAVFSWDTSAAISGAHDPAASGDRLVSALVSYSVVEDGVHFVRARWTPGVLVRFAP